MEIGTWEEHLYDSTFDSTFDSLIEEFQSGVLSLDMLEINVVEHYQIMENCHTEGSARFHYCSAMVDAHQYVLALAKKGKIEQTVMI